jgi:capsular polysaccharide transport system permease protein
MGNEDRIKKWREQRQSGGATPAWSAAGPSARSDDERSDVRAELSDLPIPSLPDDSTLEQVRLEILDRRRMRWRLFVRRALIFFGLPLLVILAYTELIATPLYQGEAVFTVQTSSDAAPAGSTTTGIFGISAGSVGDAFKAREFIISRQMMDYMEQRYGFMSHFASADMDPLTRLRGPFWFNQDPYDYYQKRVRVAVDIQEGILRLYVQARTRQDALRFGNAILTAAEAHVNSLSQKISDDQIAALTGDVQNAERQVGDARRALAMVEAQRGDLSPQQTATAVYQLISQLELQEADAERQRNALLDQGLTNSPALPSLNSRVDELKAQIAEQKRRLVNPTGTSLQTSVNEYENASSRKDIAQARWQSMLNTLQEAYLHVLEDRRYFVIVVGMSADAAPQVRDVLGIAIPLLVLLAFIYALVFALRSRLRFPRRERDRRFPAGWNALEMVKRWRPA